MSEEKKDTSKKHEVLIGALSGAAMERTLPKMKDDVSKFLKKHEEDKKKFRKEIPFIVR